MEFNPHDTEAINRFLEGKEFELTWDLYVKPPKNSPRKGEWRLKWQSDCVHLYGDEQKPLDARHRVALYIFLRERGVETPLARDLTVCYFMGTLPIEE